MKSLILSARPNAKTVDYAIGAVVILFTAWGGYALYSAYLSILDETLRLEQQVSATRERKNAWSDRRLADAETRWGTLRDGLADSPQQVAQAVEWASKTAAAYDLQATASVLKYQSDVAGGEWHPSPMIPTTPVAMTLRPVDEFEGDAYRNIYGYLTHLTKSGYRWTLGAMTVGSSSDGAGTLTIVVHVMETPEREESE